MIGMIAAVGPRGLIGAGGKIPWRYPGDFRRFKRVTMGSTVVMGRKTFESMGRRVLPGRRSIVVTTGAPPVDAASNPVLYARTLEVVADPMAWRYQDPGDIWLIGGRRIYEEGMAMAHTIDLTYVPDACEESLAASDAVFFPPIDESVFEPGEIVQHEDEPALTRRVYVRRPGK